MNTQQICQAFFDNPRKNPQTGRAIEITGPVYKGLVKFCGLDPIAEYKGQQMYLENLSQPSPFSTGPPRGTFVYDPNYPAAGQSISFEQAAGLMQQGSIARFIIDPFRQRGQRPGNTVLTLIDTDGRRYHVVAQYDSTTGQIYAPIEFNNY